MHSLVYSFMRIEAVVAWEVTKTEILYVERDFAEKVSFYSRVQYRFMVAVRPRKGKITPMKELGSGAFGKVFVGRRRGKVGTLRAIKMIRKQYNSSQATS